MDINFGKGDTKCGMVLFINRNVHLYLVLFPFWAEMKLSAKSAVEKQIFVDDFYERIVAIGFDFMVLGRII